MTAQVMVPMMAIARNRAQKDLPMMVMVAVTLRDVVDG
jgi:hypothetical protein